MPHWHYLANEEDVVAKGQQRSNREKKKPKQDKKAKGVPVGSTFGNVKVQGQTIQGAPTGKKTG